MGQALPAIGGLGAEGRPAALNQLGVGFLEALGGGHRVVGRPVTAFLVAHRIEGRQDFGGELPRLFDDL